MDLTSENLDKLKKVIMEGDKLIEKELIKLKKSKKSGENELKF